MSHNPDLSEHSEYFAARAIEERRMAMSANDPKVRTIHLDMAERYARAADGSEAGPVPAAEEPRQAG